MIISVGLVFTFCMAVGGLFIITTQKSQRLASNQRRLEVLETTIERSLAFAMGKGRSEEVQATLEMIGAQKYIQTLRIFSPRGVILRSSQKNEIGKNVNPIYLQNLRKANFRFIQNSEDNSHQINTLIKPIPNEPRCYNCHEPEEKLTGVLEIGISLEHVKRDIALVYRSVTAIVVVTLVIMAIIGIMLQSKIVHQPLQELTMKIKQVEAGDLSARVALESDDELGKLGKSFNEMVDKLDNAQNEIERYHQEQMARVDRLASVGEMAAGLAHEIRNPLTGVSGAIQIMTDDFAPEDPRKEITDEVLKQIDRVNNIIKDMLTYSRPPSPKFKTANIHEVLDEALFLTNPAAVENKVKIEKQYNPSLPEVSIDPSQIQQVFLNIFLNAVQAMPEGGTLKVRTYIQKKDGNENIIVEAEDNGPGIPQDVLKKIFSPFFSTKHRGTGLGLSVAHSIMEQHCGSISVKSECEKGTTFTITFCDIIDVV
ncbi:MAG: ATP-binding protein [Thermodesulfobacteriota bacterium]|nr:ATP-binding protein [Thermodesulfobacteriota bacterium]